MSQAAESKRRRPDVGAAAEDYLKIIYRLAGETGHVTLSQVADGLGVSAPAVTKMIKRLKADDLVSYQRKVGLQLTESGESTALRVLRNHRLLELFLYSHLGYGWDEVHEEAEKLEHVISDRFRRRIAALLGNPTHDPHGEPIPTAEGTLPEAADTKLSELQPGDSGTVRRVTDRDGDMLRYLGQLGIRPGVIIHVTRCEPFGGPLMISVDGQERAVGQELAHHVFIEHETDG